jgi:hypothetical protein
VISISIGSDACVGRDAELALLQTRIDEARAGAYELTLEALGDEAMRNSPAAFASPENAFRAVNALVAQ